MTFELGLESILHALLGSVRVFVMMISGPLFNHPGLATRIRMMLAVMVAWAAAPIGVGAIGAENWSAWTVGYAVGVEVLVGLAIGIGTGLIFAAILQLGQFMAIQGGLGLARTIDPANGAQTLAISTAFNTFALLIFLVIGGHHVLVRGIVASFEIYPVGGLGPDPGVLLEVAQMASVIWEVAFQLAAPLSVAIFVQNVATGVLGRAMPQLNLLIVNLPLHVGMLMLLVGLGANDFVHAMKDVIEVWPAQVFGVVAGVTDGG